MGEDSVKLVWLHSFKSFQYWALQMKRGFAKCSASLSSKQLQQQQTRPTYQEH